MTSGSLGLDFGTTNSAAYHLSASGQSQPITFARDDGEHSIFPTLMTLWQSEAENGLLTNHFEGGQWAMDAFLEHAPDCRFIKSIKSFAANPSFASAMIFNRRYEFSDLMYAFLNSMKHHSGAGQAWTDTPIVIGRPINFAGPRPDDALATDRYIEALKRLGFSDIRFALEPLAAAYSFVRQLDGEATIFVGDLGGGTSDFSVLRVENQGGVVTPTPLASRGLGLAGDQFDYRIIQNVVAPALGKGTTFRSLDKILPIPINYYNKMSRWNEVSMLSGSKVYRELKSLEKTATEPKLIRRFVQFVEHEMMHELFIQVSEAKRQLSTSESTHFQLSFGDEKISADIRRNDFEQWISQDIAQLDGLIDETLQEAGLSAGDIDTVFLTGGTSFVPAVVDLFKSRFGHGAIESRDQLLSVAQGLALLAEEEREDAWFTQVVNAG